MLSATIMFIALLRVIMLCFSVKKGYHKVSLKVHPDRVPEEGKEEATLKFQTLGKVYCILSNKEKRAVYDETGKTVVVISLFKFLAYEMLHSGQHVCCGNFLIL